MIWLLKQSSSDGDEKGKSSSQNASVYRACCPRHTGYAPPAEACIKALAPSPFPSILSSQTDPSTSTPLHIPNNHTPHSCPPTTPYAHIPSPHSPPANSSMSPISYSLLLLHHPSNHLRYHPPPLPPHTHQHHLPPFPCPPKPSPEYRNGKRM